MISKTNLKTIGILYLAIVVAAAVCAMLTLGVTHYMPSSVTNHLVPQVDALIMSTIGGGDAATVNGLLATSNSLADDPDKYCPKKPSEKKKSKLVVFLLAFFTGNWGVDRFYTGYVAQGVFKILTLGGMGIWTLVDWALVLADKRKMKNGCPFYKDM